MEERNSKRFEEALKKIAQSRDEFYLRIDYDRNSSTEGTGWINKNDHNMYKGSDKENESEFMHELRKAVQDHATDLVINKIRGFIKAWTVEVKIRKKFTHDNTTFTYYLN